MTRILGICFVFANFPVQLDRPALVESLASHHRVSNLQDRLFPIPTERRLLELVRWLTGRRDVFFAHTELYADLGISGDDAWELIERVQHIFGTSFAGLSLADFFPGEHDPPGGFWLRKASEKPPNLGSFTFGHLLAVVECGQWFKPETCRRTPS